MSVSNIVERQRIENKKKQIHKAWSKEKLSHYHEVINVALTSDGLSFFHVRRGGVSKFSKQVQTDGEVPGGPPRHVSVEPLGPQQLKITWQPPDRSLWNGELLGYTIGYTNLGYRYLLIALEPRQSAAFSVHPLRARSLGQWSRWRPSSARIYHRNQRISTSRLGLKRDALSSIILIYEKSWRGYKSKKTKARKMFRE